MRLWQRGVEPLASLGLALALAGPARAAEPTGGRIADGTDPRALVDAYCRTIFDATGDRFGLLRPRADTDDPTGNVEWSCEWEGTVAASAWRILSVEERASTATVTVEYQRVGVVTKRGFRREKPGPETVRYHLERDKARWWIANPPPASRVGPAALWRCHRDKLAEIHPSWWEHASKAQKARAHRLKRVAGELEAYLGRAGR